MINKEFGSDFSFQINSNSATRFSDSDIKLFFSGRVAIYALLEWGIRNEGWNKVFFPSYYCHEVIDFLKPLQIQVDYFNYNPFVSSAATIDIDSLDVIGNVILNVDFFGLKKTFDARLKNAVVVDDLTHNIASIRQSNADYCFGSLRKLLPVPCGGFLFSPSNQFVPISLDSSFAESVSIQKLTAMYLKTQYLDGVNIDKEIFRNLYIEAEESFGDNRTVGNLPTSASSVLKYLNTEKILVQKKHNLKSILARMNQIDGVECNMSLSNESALGLIMRFQACDKRDKFRSFLIKNKIYPAVLWPNQLRREDINISNSILLLHIDFRYNEDDIEYLVGVINTFFENDTNN